MYEEKIYENLVYLNQERIKINNSKELFIGKKVEKYLKLIKKGRLTRIFRELRHDVYAFFYKDVSGHQIIDFSQDAVRDFTKKVVVYTCIYGDYDDILEPLCVDSNCDYYIFTDKEIPATSVWKKGDESIFPDECDTPAKRNRYVKMFPYKFFNCDYSVYLDGNLQIVGHPSLLIQKKLSECKTGIAMHLAPRENCIYEEADNVHHVGKITKHERDIVLAMYKENGMPHHYGMCECNVIVRDHKNSNLARIMDLWWVQYCNGVKRDQLYFTYTLYKLGFSFSDVVNFGASVNLNNQFLRVEHK